MEKANIKSQTKKTSLLPIFEKYFRQEGVSVKKTRFSPESNSLSPQKLTAISFLDRVRKETSGFPDIFSKKKLYFKLDENFGLEGSNEYFLKYFSTPNSKLVIRKNFDPLIKKDNQSGSNIEKDKS